AKACSSWGMGREVVGTITSDGWGTSKKVISRVFITYKIDRASTTRRIEPLSAQNLLPDLFFNPQQAGPTNYESNAGFGLRGTQNS
ncbi:MAG: hypothetical protein WAU10_15045, partial [Caldilineaceae bacterium]